MGDAHNMLDIFVSFSHFIKNQEEDVKIGLGVIFLDDTSIISNMPRFIEVNETSIVVAIILGSFSTLLFYNNV